MSNSISYNEQACGNIQDPVKSSNDRCTICFKFIFTNFSAHAPTPNYPNSTHALQAENL